jgi:hypothetical protein
VVTVLVRWDALRDLMAGGRLGRAPTSAVRRVRWRRPLRVGVGVAFTAVVIAGAAAVGTALTSGNASTRGVVLFVGDSNVTLAAGNIESVLAWNTHSDNGYVPVMASRVGAAIRTYDCLNPTGCTTTDYWKTKLASLASKVVPDVIVNDLGVNDTSQAGQLTTPGYDHYGQKIDWFMALTGGRPVLWTNVPCSIEPPEIVTACDLIDYQLASARARWPNLTVLDWNLAAAGHPEYMAAPGTDVHYSSGGFAAWANFVVRALDRRFPSP